MSIIQTANHNAGITRIPILVEAPRRSQRPDAILSTFIGRGEPGGKKCATCDSHETGRVAGGLIVPPNAAASVVGLDRPALRGLEKKFGKLPKEGLAQILAGWRGTLLMCVQALVRI